MKKFAKEMIDKAKAAKSVEEILEFAKANSVEMTEKEAKSYFAQLNPKCGELDDDDLDNVSGGCGTQYTPKFAVGDHVLKRGLIVCNKKHPYTCSSYYWVVESINFQYADTHDIEYICQCPVCGIIGGEWEGMLQKVD